MFRNTRQYLSLSQFSRLSSFSSRYITLGRATTIGTKYFLENGQISLRQTLKGKRGQSLEINPLILSSPLHFHSNKEILDTLYSGTILKQGINCLYVYSRNEKGQIWYTNAIKSIVEAGVDREGLVTIANVGKVRTKDDLMRILDEAWTVTEQEYIDLVTLEVNLFSK
jgi:hypothetical protein